MEILTLSPDQILPPLVPMRDGMDEEALRELTASVAQHGLIQPIVVTREGDRYRLVAGSRRLAACRAAGLVEIPAVLEAHDDEAQLRAMVEENLHREQPTPLDEARVFAVLQEALGKSVMEIAGIVHKSREYVQARLRILHGPEDVREALRDGEINLSVALELERCTHDEDRAFLLSHAVSGGATSLMVRRWVQEAEMRRRQVPQGAAVGPDVVAAVQPGPIMITCEWHRGQVLMDASLSFRVCGDCFAFLGKLRDQVEKEAAGEPGQG